MPNTIIHKKSGTADKVPLTSDLANGELAINYTDRIAYSTDGSVVFEIGANVNIQRVRTELLLGNSTVNIYANSTLLKISNSTVNTTLTIPTGAQYAATNYFLHANGSWVLINLNGTPAGANQEIQFNDSLAFGSNNQFTFDKDAKRLTIGNSTVNVWANSIQISSGANVFINSIGLSIGNSTVNTWINSTATLISSTTGTHALSILATSIIMSNVTHAGTWTPSNFSISNPTHTAVFGPTVFRISNSTANIVANSTMLTLVNSTANSILTPVSLFLGNSTANVVINSISMVLGAAVSNTVITPGSLFLGNSTVNTFANSSFLRMQNSTVYSTVELTQIAVANAISGTYAQLTPGGFFGLYDGSDKSFVGSYVQSFIGNSTANATMSYLDFRLNDVSIVPFGQHTIWVPATAMIPRTTNGPATDTFETATNRVMLKTLAFDATVNEHAQFWVQMPKSWDEGTLVAQFVWRQGNTTTNFGVAWSIAAVAFNDSDPADTAFGSEVIVTDAGATNNDIYITAESAAITVAGSPTAEEAVCFQVKRLPANASDTMAIDANLIGVKIHYTTNAATDT